MLNDNNIAFLINAMLEQNIWDKEFVLNRNDYLNKKGIIDSNLYFIKKGAIRIYTQDDEIENTIRFGYKKNIVTAIDSFFSGKASLFYMQALKQTRICSISKSSFKSFIDKQEVYSKAWESILEELILQQIDREIDLLISNPRLRYERVLKRSPQLFQEIPHKYIASYLRMAPETLSRLSNLDLNQ